MNNKELIEAVELGDALGWSFTPLRGKAPFRSGWQKAPRESSTNLIRSINQGSNIGLRTGSESGIVVIDIESPGSTRIWEFPKTVTVVTGGDGYHLYYRFDGGRPVKNSCRKALGEHIDIKGENGQVVFVGSIHPDTGKKYKWQPFRSPDLQRIAMFPYHKLRDFRPRARSHREHKNVTGNITLYGRKILENAHRTVAAAARGTRHITLNATAYSMGGSVYAGYINRNEAANTLMAAATQCGLPEYEYKKTIHRALSDGEKNPKKIDVNNYATSRLMLENRGGGVNTGKVKNE